MTSRNDINSRLWNIANTDANGNITGITLSANISAANANFTNTVTSTLSANGNINFANSGRIQMPPAENVNWANDPGLLNGAVLKVVNASNGYATWGYSDAIYNFIESGTVTGSVNALEDRITIVADGNIVANFVGTGLEVNGAISSNSLAVGAANLGNVANITISGGSNGYVLRTDGAGNLSWTAQTGGGGGTPGGSNTQVQFNDGGAFGASANFTFNKSTNTLSATNVTGNGSGLTAITGANVTGTVANANYSTTSGSSTTAATVTVNAQPNITSVGTLSSLSVTGNLTAGNLIGTLANGNSNVLIAAANGNVTVTAVGNTTLTVTGTGVNIFGTANITGNANVGNIGATAGVFTGNVSANNFTGANLVSANFLTGTLTTAAQPNITALGTLSNLTSNGTINFTNASNVTLGNAANLRITGGSNGFSLLTNGSGTVTWTAPKKYQREWHIDPANGVDDSLAGSYDRPFLTLAYALTRVGNTGEILYLHAGTYTDNVTITQLNVDIVGTGATTGGIINVTGNVNVASASSSVRMWGINFANLTHSGNSTFYLKNSSVSGALSLTSASAKYFTEVVAQTGGVSITGAAPVSFDGGYIAGLTVNNASSTVSVSNSGSLAVVTVTAGILLVNNCNIYAIDATSNAITSAVGSFTYLYSSRVIGGGAAGRLSLSGFWSINDTVYDRTNSALSALNLGTISYSDAIAVTGNLSVGFLTNLGGVGNVTITGGSNGQFLRTNGSGVLSFGTVTVANIVNGNSNVTVTANGNVTTFVAGNANARMTVTSTGANIVGTANITGNTTIGGNLTVTGNIIGNVATQTTGSWTVTAGSGTYSITVPINGTYSIWVRGNIPNGIVKYIATVVVTNTNVPVLGSSYGWYYAAGNALVLTAIPTQIVGTVNSISTAVVSTTTANVFTFGITNNSGSSQVVEWGYTKL